MEHPRALEEGRQSGGSAQPSAMRTLTTSPWALGLLHTLALGLLSSYRYFCLQRPP